MIAVLNVSYPTHIFKQVIQSFASPDLPMRPESMKELSSMGYFDDGGAHAVFMLDVPDAQVAEFMVLQGKRTAYIGARAPGFTCSVQLGQKVAETIPALMPMYP